MSQIMPRKRSRTKSLEVRNPKAKIPKTSSYLDQPPIYTPSEIETLLNEYLEDTEIKEKVLVLCTGRKEFKNALTIDVTPESDPHILADVNNAFPFGLFSGEKFDLVIASFCGELNELAWGYILLLLKKGAILVASREPAYQLELIRKEKTRTYEGYLVGSSVREVSIYKQEFEIPSLISPPKVVSGTVISNMVEDFLKVGVRDRKARKLIVQFADFGDFDFTYYEISQRLNQVPEREEYYSRHMEELGELIKTAEFLNERYTLPGLDFAKHFFQDLAFDYFSTEFWQKERELSAIKAHGYDLRALRFSKEKVELVDEAGDLKLMYDQLDEEHKKQVEARWKNFMKDIEWINYRTQLDIYRRGTSKPVRKPFSGVVRGIDLTSYPATKETSLGVDYDESVLLSYFSRVSKAVCVGEDVLDFKERKDIFTILDNRRRAGELLSEMVRNCKHKYLVVHLGLFEGIEDPWTGEISEWGGHANALFVDIPNKVMERFEPNGSLSEGSRYVDREIRESIKDYKFLSSFTYLAPYLACPRVGIQARQQHLGEGGFCASFSFLTMELKMLNPGMSLLEIQEGLFGYSSGQILLFIQKYTERILGVYENLKRLEFFLDEQLGTRRIKGTNVSQIILDFSAEPPKDYITGTLVRI